MCFIEEGNILITSSGKENAFYIWKYEEMKMKIMMKVIGILF